MDIVLGAERAETFVSREAGPHELDELSYSQLEHALDAYRRGLKIYESLKSLNDIIGAVRRSRSLRAAAERA
jgi:hypothetical protein